MRIKAPFATDRISNNILYKPKFFLASEGSKSEPKYFEGLNQSIISENVTIINILRDYINLSQSHPTHLTKLLSDFIDNKNEQEITVKELKNRLLNFEHENSNKFDITSAINKLNDIYKDDKFKIKYECLDELFIELFKSDIYKDLASNFSLYFMAQDVTYSQLTDSLNMIIDRDKDNFFDNQYDEVVEFCKKNNVNLYVSNPNFEFYLMLHFKEVENEDKDKMFKNEKISSKKRYLEKRLYDICRYTKTRFSFDKFEPFIYDAINREKAYAESVEELKNNLGSNVGILVNKMINSKKY